VAARLQVVTVAGERLLRAGQVYILRIGDPKTELSGSWGGAK
jgi:hypothetical protein